MNTSPNNLRDSIPVDVFATTFCNLREDVIATTVPEFLERLPSQVPAISLFIWDEMVHRRITKSPMKIAPIINNDFHGIYDFIKTELGHEPINDVIATRYFNEFDNHSSFADVTLAQCFPEDIHIVDIEFSDNRKPIKATRTSRFQRTYRGLHVFDQFICRLKEIARARGVKRISLIVSAPKLYNVFTRHGFSVSVTDQSINAFNRAKVGYPMILHVN